MAFDPDTAPTLQDFNYDKKVVAFEAAGYVPNGIKCPQCQRELLDIPGSETKEANGGGFPSIKVLCAFDAYKSERIL